MKRNQQIPFDFFVVVLLVVLLRDKWRHNSSCVCVFVHDFYRTRHKKIRSRTCYYKCIVLLFDLMPMSRHSIYIVIITVINPLPNLNTKVSQANLSNSRQDRKRDFDELKFAKIIRYCFISSHMHPPMYPLSHNFSFQRISWKHFPLNTDALPISSSPKL